MSWFKHLPPAAQAAVIAGGVAIATALVTAISTATNLVLKARLDRRAAAAEDRGLRRALYRKYADPLTSAAESLYWRLHEIFEDGRSGYLAPGGGRTRFEHYKASSTRYRLACLLGWMTALQKELTLCNAQPDTSVAAMRKALANLEHALAEGGHIEEYKAGRLAELWGLELTKIALRDARSIRLSTDVVTKTGRTPCRASIQAYKFFFCARSPRPYHGTAPRTP